jgi:crossover junction endodeoxyribonuclease RuvC
LTILGVDPGLSATGYGILNNDRVAEYGTITTEPGEPMSARLFALGRGLEEVIERHRPAACALETLFFKGGGARSVIRSAEACGAILYALGRSSIPVVELTPATIKLSVTGSGRASKQQMSYMVKAVLGLGRSVPEHAADALAAAYCLSRRSGWR